MAAQSKKPTHKKSRAREDELRSKKAATKKKMAAKNDSKKKRFRIVLFIVEIFVLLLMGVVLYGVLKVEKTGKVEIPKEDIVINEEVKVKEETTMRGYRNIALFGVDSTTGALTKNTRSDSIMIASINQDTGECKLVSVYREIGRAHV